MEYKPLGDYIKLVDLRNRELGITNLLGVSIEKRFIPSIANTVGTDFSSYKIVRHGQFAYGPVTSRNGEKVSIALLEEDDCIISNSYTVFEITDENWLDNVPTPIGNVKMGENQREKMFVKGRERQYGMLLATLGNPDIVLEEMDSEQNVFHERPSSYLFVKTFQKPDGTKYVHFESVTVSQDGLEVSEVKVKGKGKVKGYSLA